MSETPKMVERNGVWRPAYNTVAGVKKPAKKCCCCCKDSEAWCKSGEVEFQIKNAPEIFVVEAKGVSMVAARTGLCSWVYYSATWPQNYARVGFGAGAWLVEVTVFDADATQKPPCAGTIGVQYARHWKGEVSSTGDAPSGGSAEGHDWWIQDEVGCVIFNSTGDAAPLFPLRPDFLQDGCLYGVSEEEWGYGPGGGEWEFLGTYTNYSQDCSGYWGEFGPVAETATITVQPGE